LLPLAISTNGDTRIRQVAENFLRERLGKGSAAGVAWPNNSSINWGASNQTIANGVITAVDGNGNIKIRGGGNPTHVIIDRIGFMV
jgi:hypothetical protein